MICCKGCHRHVRASERACPFCGDAMPSPLTRAFNAVGAGVTMIVLAACYGPPTSDKFDDTGDTASADMDHDGYETPQDCDDSNAAVHPGATEACDDFVDNDCDQKVDADDEDCGTGAK
jgi:hypothetical protein